MPTRTCCSIRAISIRADRCCASTCRRWRTSADLGEWFAGLSTTRSYAWAICRSTRKRRAATVSIYPEVMNALTGVRRRALCAPLTAGAADRLASPCRSSVFAPCSACCCCTRRPATSTSIVHAERAGDHARLRRRDARQHPLVAVLPSTIAKPLRRLARPRRSACGAAQSSARKSRTSQLARTRSAIFRSRSAR